MSRHQSFRVAGVDGCKAGWLVAIVKPTKQDRYIFELERLFVCRDFATIHSIIADYELVCVDIPIGLSDSNKPRECDVAARKVLGRIRASSVFPPPIRQCLPAKNYTEANKISLIHSGKGLTRQSYAIMDKIHQVDCIMTPHLQKQVREIHPEVCFWALNGCSAVVENKKTLEGQKKRRRILDSLFTGLDRCLCKVNTKDFVIDDIHDALVAAYTAGQTVLKKVKTLPTNPEIDSKGLKMEMLYPTCNVNRIIELPEPDKEGSMSLEQAIVSRRSYRDFSSKTLSLEQISQLTWVAQGQEQGGRFRNVPSAGATYPLELFAVTETGLFHYLPGKHALEEIAKEDLRGKLCSAAWGQGFISSAPLTIVITAEFVRTTGHYGKRGIRYVYLESGHAAQNIHLQAQSLGLGSVAVGAFDDVSVSSVLSLPENLEPVYMVTIGYRQ